MRYEERGRNRHGAAVAMLWAATIGLLSGCGGADPKERAIEGQELPATQLPVAEVERRSVPERIRLVGSVRAKDTAVVAPKVMGVIEAFPASLGMAVKEGELLARVRADEIDAKARQAEVQLRQARRDLERERALLAREASTPETVRNLEDRVSLLEAGLDEARVMRGYTEIRAPFDGVVARTFAEVGSLASPGSPLFELEATRGFEIEVAAPESVLVRLELGARYAVELPATGERFEATLTELAPALDRSTRSGTARFSAPEGLELRAGQYAQVTVPGAEVWRVLAPESALSRRGQLQRVFVVEEGRARMRLVEAGAVFEGQFEALAGLEAGERVLYGDLSKARDGQPVASE